MGERRHRVGIGNSLPLTDGNQNRYIFSML